MMSEERAIKAFVSSRGFIKKSRTRACGGSAAKKASRSLPSNLPPTSTSEAPYFSTTWRATCPKRSGGHSRASSPAVGESARPKYTHTHTSPPHLIFFFHHNH